MKKIIAIVMMLVFMVSTIGMAVNMHYCGKKIVKIELAGLSPEKACCNKEKKQMSCCKDEVKYYKTGSSFVKDHSISTVPQVKFIDLFVLDLLHDFSAKLLPSTQTNTYLAFSAPPKIPNDTQFVLLCTFRI